MGDVTHQQGFAHAMARMHMWLSGDDPELLVDYPQCRPIWAWCLAHNLAVAGCMMVAALYAEMRLTHGIDWMPGCGREAPGWRDE